MTGRVTVDIEPIVLLYAVRYCLSRLSYARTDGLWLIREHAGIFVANGWANTIRDDLDRYYGTDAGPALDALRAAEQRAIEGV